MAKAEPLIKNILKQVGIKINGKKPWDIQVHNPKFYSRVLAGGSLALGESYMDGWWDCKNLDQFFTKILNARLYQKIKNKAAFAWDVVKAKVTNLQSSARAYEVGEKHYDAGNDIYKNMLDKRMVYTCGYWKNAKNLNQAQEAKLDMVCKKINLKPGQKVLDIGCGWGSFAKFAAEKYKAKVVGVTVSKEQAKLARKLCKGLPVEIRLQDYREINEQFDHIISLGMFEHVGVKNYRTFMQVADRCLKPEGLFLLHTIGHDNSTTTLDPWYNKYIFPNGQIPSPKQITTAIEGIFSLEDWHNFCQDYDKTLMAWHSNFKKNWPKIASSYKERFYRQWTYYLLSAAAGFRARGNQLWQIVLSKESSTNTYMSIR